MRKPMKDIAEAIILASEFKKPSRIRDKVQNIVDTEKYHNIVDNECKVSREE